MQNSNVNVNFDAFTLENSIFSNDTCTASFYKHSLAVNENNHATTLEITNSIIEDFTVDIFSALGFSHLVVDNLTVSGGLNANVLKFAPDYGYFRNMRTLPTARLTNIINRDSWKTNFIVQNTRQFVLQSAFYYNNYEVQFTLQDVEKVVISNFTDRNSQFRQLLVINNSRNVEISGCTFEEMHFIAENFSDAGNLIGIYKDDELEYTINHNISSSLKIHYIEARVT